MRKQKQNSCSAVLDGFIFAVLVAGALFLAGFYVYQVNDLAAGGLKISGVDKQIVKLEKEVKDLQLKHSNMQSINTLKAASQKLGMTQTVNQDFLKMEREVALNK